MLLALWHAVVVAAGMAWEVGWSLVLGFVLSGVVQAVVSKERMQRALGRDGVREIALATAYGAASSSCSYASAALSKTLFKKGAAFIPTLAFLFSSTNLVIELGLVLYFLMGWQFTAAEWIGGLVLVVIMSILVKLTYPRRLVEEARAHVESAMMHEHGDNIVEGATLVEKLRNPRTIVVVAQNVAMDWSMLWKDLVAGFLIAGALAVFVPDRVWSALFFNHASPSVQIIAGGLIGPLVAIITFVCSIGNVPMAAVLWSGGAGFAGVLSFLYADLIVLPLLDVYRKYYGWRIAAYVFIAFFVTMAAAGMLMAVTFGALHLIPAHPPSAVSLEPVFRINYTFWLNAIFGALVFYLWMVNRRNPMMHHHHHAGVQQT